MWPTTSKRWWESQTECGNYAEQLDKAVNVVVKLNNISEVVDAQPDDEDASDVDSHILEIALEGLYQELGVKLPHRLSMEAQADTSWKERGSRIKEQILELLRAIAEVLRRTYDHLRVYLQKVFALAARMERFAAQELRRVRGLTGSPNTTGYSNERLSRAVTTPDATVMVGYERLFTLVEDAERSATSGFAQKVADMVNAYVEGKDTSSLTDEFPRLFEKTFSGIFEHDASNAIIERVGAPEGVTVHTTAYLPGGYLGVIGVPDTTDDLGKFIFAIRRPEDHEDPEATLKVLTLDDIRWALDSIVKTCSKIRRFEVMEKRQGSMVSLLDKAASRLKNSEDKYSDEDKKFLRALARVAPTLARGIHQQTFTFALSSFRALIEHCQHSAAHYAHKDTAQPATPAKGRMTMLLKRALTPAVEATVVSLESGVPEADAAELDPMEADAMIDEGPHEAEDAEAAIHKLHTAAVSLEELEEMVIGAKKSGGLNSQGAHAAGIALEHILETLGLPQPDLKVALEDFDQDSSDGPTTLVLESVSETLEKVWKAGCARIRRPHDPVVQGFRGRQPRLHGHADQAVREDPDRAGARQGVQDDRSARQGTVRSSVLARHR
jgi:hypothetical protein